jgi:hypothetical protein
VRTGDKREVKNDEKLIGSLAGMAGEGKNPFMPASRYPEINHEFYECLKRLNGMIHTKKGSVAFGDNESQRKRPTRSVRSAKACFPRYSGAIRHL